MKKDRKAETLYDTPYMWYLKRHNTIEPYLQNRETCRLREQTYGCWWGEGIKKCFRKSTYIYMYLYAHMYIYIKMITYVYIPLIYIIYTIIHRKTEQQSTND